MNDPNKIDISLILEEWCATGAGSMLSGDFIWFNEDDFDDIKLLLQALSCHLTPA